MPTEHEHPLELLYHARQAVDSAGSSLVHQPYPPGEDTAAYTTALTSLLDGLYLIADTLVRQWSMWPRVFPIWPPADYERLLRLHTAVRIMLLNLHGPRCP